MVPFSNNNRNLYNVYILHPNVYILAGPCKKNVSEHNGAAARFLNIFSKLSMKPFVSSKMNLIAFINCSDFILKFCRRIGQNIIVPTASGFGMKKMMLAARFAPVKNPLPSNYSRYVLYNQGCRFVEGIVSRDEYFFTTVPLFKFVLSAYALTVWQIFTYLVDCS
jgi:hypothetical protein